ncbi:MAG: NUDIX domain-containing protein [Candidatus Saccharimonadales bacterium]
MRVSVRAIVIRGDQFLVMDRNRFGHKFMSLIGGAVDVGEKNEDALIREVKEETSMVVSNPKLVIEEDAGEIYGLQYIYLCDYLSGEPKLSEDGPEFKINQMGQNLYTPRWIKVDELQTVNLLPMQLKEVLLEFLRAGFPSQPIKLSISKDSEL